MRTYQYFYYLSVEEIYSILYHLVNYLTLFVKRPLHKCYRNHRLSFIWSHKMVSWIRHGPGISNFS